MLPRLCRRSPASAGEGLSPAAAHGTVAGVCARAGGGLGEILSAFEFLDRGALELTQTELEGVRDPLPGAEPFYLVVETSGSNAEHDYAKLEARAPLG